MTQDTTPKGLLVTCSNCKREIDLGQEQCAIFTEPGPRDGEILCMECYEPERRDRNTFTSPTLNYAHRRRMTDKENKALNESWIRAYWRTK